MKEKYDLQKQIHSLELEHETYRQLLTEIRLEEDHVQKQIVSFQFLSLHIEFKSILGEIHRSSSIIEHFQRRSSHHRSRDFHSKRKANRIG